MCHPPPADPRHECLRIEEEVEHPVVDLAAWVVARDRRRDSSGDPFEGADLAAVAEREPTSMTSRRDFVRATGRQPMLQRGRLTP
jgi:hypothetical protein